MCIMFASDIGGLPYCASGAQRSVLPTQFRDPVTVDHSAEVIF